MVSNDIDPTISAKTIRPPGVQPDPRDADETDMRSRRALLTAALFSTLAAGGCLMPNGGTPVFVDSRAGAFWSGKGLLTEVSPDQKRCKVAIRDSALFVHETWVDCTSVHPRRGR